MAPKPTVLLTEPAYPEVVGLLDRHTNLTVGNRGHYNSEDALIEGLKGMDGLLCMLSNPVTAKVIESTDTLKVIANYAVGYNNIDVDAASRRQIPVGNTPDVLTETTAEGTFALMLAVARRISESERDLRDGNFDGWAPNAWLGFDLSGRTLGILGMGRIGQALARKARAFGMEVIYHNRNRLPDDVEISLGATFVPTVQELARNCDVLSLNCPLNEETRHIINGGIFKLMKKDAILINAARGPVVDEAALADALNKRLIWGAGLDVYEHEPEIHPGLLTAPNTVLLPHITSATFETRRKMGMLAAGAVLNVLCGLDMPCNFVNR